MQISMQMLVASRIWSWTILCPRTTISSVLSFPGAEVAQTLLLSPDRSGQGRDPHTPVFKMLKGRVIK